MAFFLEVENRIAKAIRSDRKICAGKASRRPRFIFLLQSLAEIEDRFIGAIADGMNRNVEPGPRSLSNTIGASSRFVCCHIRRGAGPEQGELHLDRDSAPRPIKGAHFSVVQFDRSLGDSKTNAESSRILAACMIHAIERPENGFEIAFGNALAVVADLQNRGRSPIILFDFEVHLDLRTGIGVSHRIAHDVFNRPIQQLPIAVDHAVAAGSRQIDVCW